MKYEQETTLSAAGAAKKYYRCSSLVKRWRHPFLVEHEFLGPQEKGIERVRQLSEKLMVVQLLRTVM